MDDLAFDDLKLFARVAALGSLSAVARERDVPVSQVTRALARLEAQEAGVLVEAVRRELKSALARIDALEAQRDRVAGSSRGDPLKVPRRFGSISKPQPAFGSFNVMTVREPQLFHDEWLYGAQPRSVKGKMPQTLLYPLLFGRNHPASPTR